MTRQQEWNTRTRELLAGLPSATYAACRTRGPNARRHPKAKALDIRSNGPTKYLKESRTDLSIKDKPRGGWNKLKSDADIAAALKEGNSSISCSSAVPPRRSTATCSTRAA